MPVRDHFRAYARQRVNLGASLRDNVGSLVQDARIRDLGLGGACLEIADARPPAGTPQSQGAPGRWLDPDAIVTVEVTAPTLWDPLTLRGKIAWVKRGATGRPTRAGVRFEHRDSASLYALFQLLSVNAYET